MADAAQTPAPSQELIDRKADAEIRKLEAEALLARTEAERERIFLAQAEAEAREAEAKALNAEIERKVNSIALKAVEEEDERRRKGDDYFHVYRFNQQVTDQSVRACQMRLDEWDRLDPECDIEVIFSSPGGSVIAGMALFDVIHRLSRRGGGTHNVTVGIAGMAASMAAILVQAGDTRWIGSQSYMMIHELSAITGGKLPEIEDDAEFYRTICDRMAKLFVDRSDGKMSMRKFKSRWNRRDWWLTAEEALEAGFVDEIR